MGIESLIFESVAITVGGMGIYLARYLSSLKRINDDLMGKSVSNETEIIGRVTRLQDPLAVYISDAINKAEKKFKNTNLSAIYATLILIAKAPEKFLGHLINENRLQRMRVQTSQNFEDGFVKIDLEALYEEGSIRDTWKVSKSKISFLSGEVHYLQSKGIPIGVY